MIRFTEAGPASTRRRHLREISGLGSAALIGLAGCTGNEPGGSDGGTDGSATPPGSSPNDSGGTRPSGTGGPGVTIVSVDGDLDIPIEPAVERVREAATTEHPPQLRTTLTNTSNQQVGIGEGRAVHFEYVSDTSGALVLLPGGGEYPAEPDCWRLTEGVPVTEEYRTFEIESGGSSSRPVDLYATPDGDACLPVGEYRFETTVSIVSAESEPRSSAQWGFTILLE
jgi:hypothetical protein